MYVVSAGLGDPDPLLIPEGLRYGIPCAFKGCSGVYHPAEGQTGVVLCSPWGYEDLTMRKSWRLLAEAIAKAGYPCVRFDYPGTGDSLGAMTDVVSFEAWTGAIAAAADVLRLNSGVRRFVFVGQSLGAALAFEAARRRSDVVGLQLIAPVVKGRAYVRELAATATMVADRVGITLDLAADEGLSVVGFALSRAMTENLKTLDLTKADRLDVADVTIFDSADRKAGAEVGEHLRRLGASVTIEPVAPYQLMVSDATVIQPLPVSAEAVIAALHRAAPPAVVAPPMPVPAFPAALVTEAFREEPLRFGRAGALFGVLCRPLRPRPDAPVVVLLNRGLNAHVGWRRTSVDHARGLAAAGLASLRIDVAGIGESRDEVGRPVNLIYSDLLLPDIRAAVDAVIGRGYPQVVLAGVCSGAYMALAAAQDDPRVCGVVVVNAQRFLWNPAESIDDVIRYGLRSMNDYVGDIRGGQMLRKLIRSRRRIIPAMRFLVLRNIKAAMTRVPLRLRSLVMRNSMAARIDRLFTTLEERGTRVSLAYSENDPGLRELRHYFGPLGRDLNHPNVSVSLIPGADHNLTSTAALLWMQDHMIAFAGERPRDQGRVAARALREPRVEVCPT